MSLIKSIHTGSDIIMKTEFTVDRSKYMNASEAISCIRRQWYQKNMPEKAAKQDWGYANRGKIIEAFVVDAMRAANVPIAFAGDEQESVFCDKRKISATPDGVIVWSTKKQDGIEIKSIDPRKNRSKLPTKAHVVQLQTAMALLNMQPEHKIKKGTLLYVDASNIHDILEFEVKADNAVLDRLAPRAKLLLTTKKAAKLEREGKISGDCKYCAFSKQCGVTPEKGVAKKKANKGSKMDSAVRDFVELKEQMASLKETQDVAKELIKQELHKRKTSEVTIGGYLVKLTEVKGRTSLDKKAVKKAGIDLSPFEKVGASSERLNVTVQD